MKTVSKYFETLRDWKKLPAYKAEPRVDSIVGFALPQILKHALNLDVKVVIPELPLRVGTIYRKHEGTNYSNKSYKVDFFALTTSNENYLIEFKTDSGSRREGQDKYLEASKEVGIGAIITGILTLFEKTSYKKKYEHLLGKLLQAQLIQGEHPAYKPSAANDSIKIVYIQPHIKSNDENLTIIDFNSVHDAIIQNFPNDEFMVEAAKTFKGWESN